LPSPRALSGGFSLSLRKGAGKKAKFVQEKKQPAGE